MTIEEKCTFPSSQNGCETQLTFSITTAHKMDFSSFRWTIADLWQNKRIFYHYFQNHKYNFSIG
jgi:hypothetical protein